MSETLLVALIAIIPALSGFILSVITNRNAASREEVKSLRETIEALTKENERLRKRVSELEAETILQDKQIATMQDEKFRQDEEITILKKKLDFLVEENGKLKARKTKQNAKDV